MTNKPEQKLHDKTKAQGNAEDRPTCAGKVTKGKRAGKPCRLESTLLGDEYGNPACQWHGGRPDPSRQSKPRSTTVAALSSKHPTQGGVSVMGTTSNETHSSRWTMLTNGTLDVSELDTEELAKGMVRDADGKFRGRPSQMVPRTLMQAMKAELWERAQSALESDLVNAAEMLGEIARSPDVEPQHRIKAAQLIIERVMGSTPKTIAITSEKPYEQLMTKIMRVKEEPQDPVIIEMRKETGDDRF